MHCPYCGFSDTKVIDSRLIAEGQQIRRRRECPSCNERFTTFETAELLMPRVIKQKNNSREPFDEHKLREGLYRSLEKRPVGEEEIETRRVEVSSQLAELHSRVTTNTKEIMSAAASQHAEQNKEIQKLHNEINLRIGVLEKWRHVLIGGSIVIGFLLHKFIDFT